MMIKWRKLTDNWYLGNCNLASLHIRTRSSASSPPKHLPSPCTGWAALQGWVNVLLGKEGELWMKHKWQEQLLVMEGDFPLLALPLKRMISISSTRFSILFPYHFFSKQPLQFQAHLQMGHFSAGQRHVQSRLGMFFHWHQEFNLVQRWLDNVRSYLSSPPSVASSIHKAAWPVSAIAQQKTNRGERIWVSWVTYKLVLKASVRVTTKPALPAASV